MINADTHRVRMGDIVTAIALLTRLPVVASFERSAAAAWAYPIAGAVVAAIAGVLSWVCLGLGVPAGIAAIVWIASSAVITGAMHEDGLADTVDGFWGGWEPARRLEIMKDSQIGSYGVIALCLSLALRWSVVAGLMTQGAWFWPLVAIAMVSRACMPAIMVALPHARQTGLSHAQGVPPQKNAEIGAFLAGSALVVVLGFSAIWMLVLVAISTVLVAGLARHKIGGQTGDVLGACQQVAEITLLIALSTQLSLG